MPKGTIYTARFVGVKRHTVGLGPGALVLVRRRFVSSETHQLGGETSTTRQNVQARAQAPHTGDFDEDLDLDLSSTGTGTCSLSTSSGASTSADTTIRTSAQTGSAKLFADALLEEERESKSESESQSSRSSQSSASASAATKRASQVIQAHTQGENWTGEESVRDAVLRMLVDKYKPLRGPVVRSAEEKMREVVPSVRSSPPSSPPTSSATSTSASASASTGYKPDWTKRASEPLLPAIAGHRPWHTTFTAPSTLSVHVKVGRSSLSPSSSARQSSAGEEGGCGGGGGKMDLAALRRSANAQRLGRAREETLDYKLGLSPRSPSPSSPSSSHTSTSQPRRPPPTNTKAWASLIEERIERARHEGQFSDIKGRGRPLVRETAEFNPFIAREEFLMNRIVQRNSAAPAWVELQGEVDSAIRTFRLILRQSWTRRAVLTLTSSPSRLSSLTLTDIRALRDPTWVQKEKAYHDAALAEVNEVVRRYNGVAPYAVRKAYFSREAELERCFWECGEDVLEGIRERVRRGSAGEDVNMSGGGEEEGGSCAASSGSVEEKRIGIWRMIREWVASLRA